MTLGEVFEEIKSVPFESIFDMNEVVVQAVRDEEDHLRGDGLGIHDTLVMMGAQNADLIMAEAPAGQKVGADFGMGGAQDAFFGDVEAALFLSDHGNGF